ncbi:hypothetical protein HZB01_02810 [Candidatus Woesearchaeota archaeon]|nr:hypothetical protein [Candidatus Woesearchaeota archaeon]
MQKKPLLFITLFLVVASLVFAAGGGGGGSSGGGSLGGGSGPIFTRPICDDKGSISFAKTPVTNKTVTAVSPSSIPLAVPGSWRNRDFVSEEEIFNETGSYKITVDEKNVAFTCPGLKFSCKNVALALTECTLDNNFLTATFSVEGVSYDELAYTFRQSQGGPKKYAKGNPGFGQQLQIVQIRKNTFYLHLSDAENITELQLSHPLCVGAYYRYAKMDCVTKGEKNQPPKTGQTLKCGGYMEIEDRVKCRLSLREEQRDEWENFFPEECKAKEGKAQESCLTFYKNVQQCWKFPNGRERIDCVKQQLSLGDIETQKIECGLSSNTETVASCQNVLREKVYALVKFRLYNLEENAEELMEDGRLTPDQVAAFVVIMEQKKLAFNSAQSNDERKQILLDARKAWQHLMEQVKP